MATLTQLTDDARQDIAIDPNGDLWPDAQIKRYINEFVGEVYTWLDLDFAELTDDLTLVAGTNSYDLSTELSNYGRVESIRLAGRYTDLQYVENVSEFEEGLDTTQQNEPSQWTFYGDNTILLSPTPDGVIATATVRYNRAAPTLADGESPAWDSAWHHVPKLYAIWQCFQSKVGFETKAQAAAGAFFEKESQMKHDLWIKKTGGLRMQNMTRTAWPV